MMAYLAYIRMAVVRVLAYRLSLWIGVAGTCLGMAIQYYLWTAIFGGAAAPGEAAAGKVTLAGYSASQAVTYVVLGQALGGFLALEGEPAGRKVREGSIATDLARPVDWQWAVFCDYLGSSLLKGMAVGVPAMAVATALHLVTVPASGLALGVFLVSAALAFTLLFAWSFLIGLLSFWTKGGGLVDLQAAVIALFSGALVPLEFYPSPLRELAMILPFRGIYHLPLSIYTGRLQVAEAGGALVLQAAWAVGLFVLARVLWARATRSLTIQGG
jgi:ABC-2 type transport system permease protein